MVIIKASGTCRSDLLNGLLRNPDFLIKIGVDFVYFCGIITSQKQQKKFQLKRLLLPNSPFNVTHSGIFEVIQRKKRPILLGREDQRPFLYLSLKVIPLGILPTGALLFYSRESIDGTRIKTQNFESST